MYVLYTALKFSLHLHKCFVHCRLITVDCQLITTTGRRRLRSSNVATCDVPRTRTTLGDRSFTAAGPHLWNNLRLHLRDFDLSLSEFRRLLKLAEDRGA